MDIDLLIGKELDEYGESLGIVRYVGFISIEDDKSYRENIRRHLNEHLNEIENISYSSSLVEPDNYSRKWYTMGKFHAADGPAKELKP